MLVSIDTALYIDFEFTEILYFSTVHKAKFTTYCCTCYHHAFLNHSKLVTGYHNIYVRDLEFSVRLSVMAQCLYRCSVK
jgi:hypothetical protein